MSLSFLGIVYSEPNKQGISRLVGVGNSDRYNPISADTLKGLSLYGDVQSVDLFGSAGVESNLIIFPNDDYTGGFAQAIDSKGGGDANWNVTGAVKSMLLVATNRIGKSETRLSFRTEFLTTWDNFLDAKLANTQVSRVGDPTLTWEMFPENMQYLDSRLTYLKIYQPLHISIDWWPDYSAAMTYYIYLYVTQGVIRAYGARSDSWVEGGAKNGKIHDQLDPQVAAGLGALSDQVNAKFMVFDALGPFSDIYLLPGNQLTDSGTGGVTGNTNDDVTIVIEK